MNIRNLLEIEIWHEIDIYQYLEIAFPNNIL